MVILGALIGSGAAIAFLLVGALVLFGGADATRGQLLPGFAPDQPRAGARFLTFLGLWAPIILVATLCLLAGIQFMRVIVAALL
ncbi:MAG: hypothetical protein SH847_14685 [Roseiflexaceae bacterium]|nr:hypothetical protein [Roseiflexaceae bacterium]